MRGKKGNDMYTRREFFSILIPPQSPLRKIPLCPPLLKGDKGGLKKGGEGDFSEPKMASEKRELSECPECGRPYFQDDNPDGCPSCKKGMDKRVAEILFGKKGG